MVKLSLEYFSNILRAKFLILYTVSSSMEKTNWNLHDLNYLFKYISYTNISFTIFQIDQFPPNFSCNTQHVT